MKYCGRRRLDPDSELVYLPCVMTLSVWVSSWGCCAHGETEGRWWGVVRVGNVDERGSQCLPGRPNWQQSLLDFQQRVL